MTWRPPVIILAVLLIVSGCSSSPYESGYTYFPQPATIDLRRVGSNEPSPITVLVTILGIRNADPKQYIPYSVAVRMRFDNVSRSRISFDARSLELVTGTLQPFPPPVVEPPQPFELAPGERRDMTAYFRFPPNTKASQMNLQNLRLRWEVKVDGYPAVMRAVFSRVENGYYPESDVYY